MSEESIRNNYNDSSSTIEDIETAINNTISECESAKGKINEL
jgi:methionine synthase II (cobalamin-independent)